MVRMVQGDAGNLAIRAAPEPPTCAGWCGTDCSLWVDARETLLDLFLLIERNLLEKMAICVETDIDVIIGMDDTSTTAISPAMFEACNLELTDKRAQVAHAAGIPYFHHSCGHIKDLLPLYRRTQMDGVHAFTVPPTGNVTIAEGRELLGDRVTIFAGIDPNWDRALLRQTAMDAVRVGNVILGLTAYPNKTMEETRAALDCVRRALDEAPATGNNRGSHR